jgi:chloramphenicol 3-O phosphotransferase
MTTQYLPGKIIYLTGPSSAGKTSLALELQRLIDEPFLHVGSDAFIDMAIRRNQEGPFNWWNHIRPRLFAGFHASLRALADAGNNLIVDSLIEFPEWRTRLAQCLLGLDVFLVGLHCDVVELNRRELQRGDRRAGEARGHLEVDRVHSFGPYDLDLETSCRGPYELALELLTHWQARTDRRVLAAEVTNTA